VRGVGAVVDKQVDDVGVALVAGAEQGGPLVSVLGVHRRAARNEGGRDRGVALGARRHQRRAANLCIKVKSTRM